MPDWIPWTPSLSEVTKKPALTPTSERSFAATDDVVPRCVTLPSWVPVTVPVKVRGSTIATCRFSTSARWSAS